MTNEQETKAKETETVPYIVHEGILARMERIIRRLWILTIILILLLVGTNLSWLIYESQYQVVETTQTVTQDTDGGDGNNSFVGGDVNGETDSDN